MQAVLIPRPYFLQKLRGAPPHESTLLKPIFIKVCIYRNGLRPSGSSLSTMPGLPFTHNLKMHAVRFYKLCKRLHSKNRAKLFIKYRRWFNGAF
jgi:hypothetical protein